jgi:hypothetical protein
MKWNIFKRVRELEAALVVSESNVLQLYKAFNAAMLRVQRLEDSIPRSLSEAEVKKRLKAAAYSRAYYKNKKAVSAAKDMP